MSLHFNGLRVGEENDNCVADDMAEPAKVNGAEYSGVGWEPADKSPGLRKQGWGSFVEFLATLFAPKHRRDWAFPLPGFWRSAWFSILFVVMLTISFLSIE